MPLIAPRFARNTRLEECLTNLRPMREPEEGEAVSLVQQALVDLRFELPVSGVDGRFGQETADRVIQFKIAHGIEPHDPVVGPKTMSKLDELCADQPRPDRPIPALNFTRQD